MNMKIIMLLLTLAGTAVASVATDSFLGLSSKRIPVGTQFIAAKTIYLHINVRKDLPGQVWVTWYAQGRLIWSDSLTGTATTAYRSRSVSSRPGVWTVVIDGANGRRTHCFTVTR